MKRTIITLTLAVLLVFTMASCGRSSGNAGKDEGNGSVAAEDNSSASGDEKSADESESTTGNTDSESDENAGSAVDSAGGIFKTPDSELTDYINEFTDAEKPFSDILSNSDASDMDELSAQMAVAVPNLDLAFLCEFDLINGGKLALSGFDGEKKKSGSKITFSASHTYDANATVYKEGDKITEEGWLDTSSNELSFESKVERGGKVISRTVLEAVILKDGTHLMNYLKVAEPYREEDPPSTTATFKRFDKDGFKAVYAEFDPDFNFKYNSILGKGDVQVDEMAGNYTVKGTFTVSNGKMEYKK